MGQSTDGIVFYGFSIDDGSEIHEKIAELSEENDYDEIVAKTYGWDGKKPQYAFEWEKKHPSPVTIGLHCSYDYPMYYIAIKQSEVKASRGYPESFTPEVKPDWDEKLRDFCTKLKVPVPEKFSWIVTSMWG